MSSLRAELFAAMMGLHVLFESGALMSSAPKVVVTLVQDSLAAQFLLKECLYSKSPRCCPSHRTREHTWKVECKWGQTLTTQNILEQGDVLDRWWLLTADVDVEFKWIESHTTKPDAADNNKLLADWLGNDTADRLAKMGAKMSYRDPVFRGLPLMQRPIDTDERDEWDQKCRDVCMLEL